MREFAYLRATCVDEAIRAAAVPGAMLLAGGTTLLDLAKCGVLAPDKLVDVTHLGGLDTIKVDADGAYLGSLTKMAQVASHVDIKSQFPAVAESLSLAASAQIRNMATIGGNLLQRTRCAYFRDPALFPACNKRAPGSGCSAIGGINRNHAILGGSDACIATYPGDLAVALVAFDAMVHLGNRLVAIDDFFLWPGSTRTEFDLRPGEMITAVSIPTSAAARRSTYLKVRDRQSYEFAAASAAVGIELEADGQTIRDVRVALGGVATKPWRARSTEAALKGKLLDVEAVRNAAALAAEQAVDRGDNGYKIELVKRLVERAILKTGAAA